MKEIIKRNWKKIVSFVLVVAMVAAYLPANMTEVKAENTSVSFSLASAAPQDADGRYLITVNVSGVSIPNDATGWESHGVSFHYLDETLLAKYGYVKEGHIGCGKCEYEYLILPKV